MDMEMAANQYFINNRIVFIKVSILLLSNLNKINERNDIYDSLKIIELIEDIKIVI